jgi:hypothetical protein
MALVARTMVICYEDAVCFCVQLKVHGQEDDGGIDNSNFNSNRMVIRPVMLVVTITVC